MEVFKKHLKIDNWAVVYLGILKEWIMPHEVVKYCESGNIICDEDCLVELYLAYDESLSSFLELVENFVAEEGYSVRLWKESIVSQDFIVIPQKFWGFWEVEFLLRIVNSDGDKENKLHKVAAIHSDFNYPSAWHSFLYFMPSPNNIPIGINALYNNLINYIDERLKLYSRY